MTRGRLYSVEDVAQLLGLHVKTVRGYVRDGRLEAVRIGRQYRIPAAALEAFTGQALPAGPSAAAAGPPDAEVSSIVRIDDIDRPTADRVSTLVVSSANGPRDGDERVRVETAYDPERARMQIIVVGDPASTAELLGLVAALLEDRS